MDFYIHMKGSQIGYLNIYQAPVEDFNTLKASWNGEQSTVWFHKRVKFDSKHVFQVRDISCMHSMNIRTTSSYQRCFIALWLRHFFSSWKSRKNWLAHKKCKDDTSFQAHSRDHTVPSHDSSVFEPKRCHNLAVLCYKQVLILYF